MQIQLVKVCYHYSTLPEHSGRTDNDPIRAVITVIPEKRNDFTFEVDMSQFSQEDIVSFDLMTQQLGKEIQYSSKQV